MKRLIQFPAAFDYNILSDALQDYKKPRDKIRGLLIHGVYCFGILEPDTGTG